MKYQIVGSWVNDKGKACRAPRRRPEVLTREEAIQKLAELIEMYGAACNYTIEVAQEKILPSD